MLTQELVTGTWRFAPFTIMTHEIMRYGASVEVAKVFTSTELGRALLTEGADVQAGLEEAYRKLIKAKDVIEKHYRCIIQLAIENGVPRIISIERPDDYIDKEQPKWSHLNRPEGNNEETSQEGPEDQGEGI